MKIIMQDQNKRMRIRDGRREISDILIRMLIVFGIFVAIATGFTVFSISNAQGSVTGAVTDNLMSDDMSEYTALYGHDADFDEGDME